MSAAVLERQVPERVAAVDSRDLARRHGCFTAVQVCELAGITYRQIDYWTRQGVLETVTVTHGTGTARLFAPAEVRVASAIREAALAISSPFARELAEHIRAHGMQGRLRNGCWSLWLEDLHDPIPPAHAC